ncbi:hypothetical protein BC830DRAFT_1154907 [Chytriomyces sp. MP71]|nr:hypothetical protein BC830DRAFT_1154907 [Chytriomyces sp. MP71]
MDTINEGLVRAHSIWFWIKGASIRSMETEKQLEATKVHWGEGRWYVNQTRVCGSSRMRTQKEQLENILSGVINFAKGLVNLWMDHSWDSTESLFSRSWNHWLRIDGVYRCHENQVSSHV